MVEKVLSQAIEEIKSSKNQTIAALEAQIEEKDKRIKLLEQKIEMLEAMQHIDADNPIKNYPFTPGVAEKEEQYTTRV
jgi:predicted RNase H-like nuclease (RuvC/YqgF family)